MNLRLRIRRYPEHENLCAVWLITALADAILAERKRIDAINKKELGESC